MAAVSLRFCRERGIQRSAEAGDHDLLDFLGLLFRGHRRIGRQQDSRSQECESHGGAHTDEWTIVRLHLNSPRRRKLAEIDRICAVFTANDAY